MTTARRQGRRDAGPAAFLNGPTGSFFSASTDTTGSPALGKSGPIL